MTNIGCEPFAKSYQSISNPRMYESDEYLSPASNPDQIKVVTWNIRWGCGRLPWFVDSCGEMALADYESVEEIMEKIADTLNSIDADIVLLQEVDIESKRSGFMDQMQYLLNNTNLNYGAYASMMDVDFVFSDGLGRINTGNAILSKFQLTEAERIKLRLRTDQTTLVQYGYARRNILKAKIPELSQGSKDFYAVNIHATAFATDDTKKQHINKYVEILSDIQNNNNYFVTGGDLNSVPPGSVIDFCESDKCDGENCDGDYENNEAYHGSYFEHFEGEPEILVPLYNSYDAAINLADANLPVHYSHAPSTSFERNNIKYDRKLSYLFTNKNWIIEKSITHQSAWEISDHMPISSVVMISNR
ncbi:MAG: hypothetical protein CMG63_03885 [Candidatus Marinimicrobia bacterium]|nr:hypothetical protein [Candidatus Neomarinimicrobiota bacterium]